MYIKSLEYETIEYLKNNINTVFKNLESKTFNEIFDDVFGIGWFKQSKILLPDLDFHIDKNVSPKNTDIMNAKIIYESLKNLTESQASDERLWSGLAIDSKSYDYLKFRWKETTNTLKYRVVFHVPGKRGLMYHGLARLWWFAHITYDHYRENSYELTEFTLSYPHILEKMIYRNFSNSSIIRLGIIEGIKKFIEDDGIYKIDKIDELYKYISTLGSVSLVDNISKEEISELVYNFLVALE
jgi:hypothetical protein